MERKLSGVENKKIPVSELEFDFAAEVAKLKFVGKVFLSCDSYELGEDECAGLGAVLCDTADKLEEYFNSLYFAKGGQLKKAETEQD